MELQYGHLVPFSLSALKYPPFPLELQSRQTNLANTTFFALALRPFAFEGALALGLALLLAGGFLAIEIYPQRILNR